MSEENPFENEKPLEKVEEPKPKNLINQRDFYLIGQRSSQGMEIFLPLGSISYGLSSSRLRIMR